MGSAVVAGSIVVVVVESHLGTFDDPLDAPVDHDPLLDQLLPPVPSTDAVVEDWEAIAAAAVALVVAAAATWAYGVHRRPPVGYWPPLPGADDTPNYPASIPSG